MKNIFAPLLLVSKVIFSAHIYAEPTSTCKEVKFKRLIRLGVGTIIYMV